MSITNTKPYIINLKYGTWENQLWFQGQDSPEGQQLWEQAKKGLPAVAENCRTAGEYFSRAVEHFRNQGFSRIQR